MVPLETYGALWYLYENIGKELYKVEIFHASILALLNIRQLFFLADPVDARLYNKLLFFRAEITSKITTTTALQILLKIGFPLLTGQSTGASTIQLISLCLFIQCERKELFILFITSQFCSKWFLEDEIYDV